MSGPVTVVTVTWMDGKQETYRCSYVTVHDNVLRLDWDRYPASGEPARRIPLINVRYWIVED